MAYCPNCSSPLDAQASQCAKCGARLGAGSVWKPIDGDPPPIPAGIQVKKPFSRMTLGVIGVLAVGSLAIVVSGYFQYRERSQAVERIRPFAEVVVLGKAEAEAELIKRGLIDPSDAPRPACGLDSCGADLVRKYSVAPDGVVSIQLAGERVPALEGKFILLRPQISQRKVAWTCVTDAPQEAVPSPDDRVSASLQSGFCSIGVVGKVELPDGSGKPTLLK